MPTWDQMISTSQFVSNLIPFSKEHRTFKAISVWIICNLFIYLFLWKKTYCYSAPINGNLVFFYLKVWMKCLKSWINLLSFCFWNCFSKRHIEKFERVIQNSKLLFPSFPIIRIFTIKVQCNDLNLKRVPKIHSEKKTVQKINHWLQMENTT